MLERPAKNQAARERKARFHERRLAGRFVAPVEVTPAIIDVLVALYELREADAADPRKVGKAIAAALTKVEQK